MAYTTTEVAHALGVSPRTVTRWIALGDLPSVRIAGTLRVPIQAFHVKYPEVPPIDLAVAGA